MMLPEVDSKALHGSYPVEPALVLIHLSDTLKEKLSNHLFFDPGLVGCISPIHASLHEG